MLRTLFGKISPALPRAFEAIRHTFTIALDCLFPPSAVARALRKGALPVLPPAEPAAHAFIRALSDYKDDFVEQMIWELKFERNRDVAHACAPYIYEVIKREQKARDTKQGNVRPFLLIPVPISQKKRRERGFNQVEMLCEEIMSIDDGGMLRYTSNAVRKIRHTKNQHDISNRAKRLENLKGAFAVCTPAEISGCDIILIDDVCTTSATLCELKSVLEAAGAQSVRAITIAH